MLKRKSIRARWARQLQADMEFAQKILLEHGELARTFVVHTKDGAHVIGAPWESDMQKRRFLLVMKAFCIATDAEAVIFMSEAWARDVSRAAGETEAEFEARVDAVRASEAEDRIEVVMLACMYRDGRGQRRVITNGCEVERGADGAISGFKARADCDSEDVFQGPIVEVLGEEPPTPTQRFAAQQFLDKIMPGVA